MGNPVTIIDVHFEPNNGVGAIDPCANILKGLYTAGTTGSAGFDLQVGFQYMAADGSHVSLSARVALKGNTTVVGESLDKRFVVIDVHIAPAQLTSGQKIIPEPQAGAQCLAEARIVTQSGEEVAESSSSTVFFPGQATTPGP